MEPAESQPIAQQYYAPQNYYGYEQPEEQARSEHHYVTQDDFYMQRLSAIRHQIEEELQNYALKQQQMQYASQFEPQENGIESRLANAKVGKRSTLWHNNLPFMNERVGMNLSPYAYPNPSQPEYSPQLNMMSAYYQQQPHPKASCGSNLLIGCQPQVQHVPCSSSYESPAQSYPIQPYPVPAAPIYSGLTSAYAPAQGNDAYNMRVAPAQGNELNANVNTPEQNMYFGRSDVPNGNAQHESNATQSMPASDKKEDAVQSGTEASTETPSAAQAKSDKTDTDTSIVGMPHLPPKITQKLHQLASASGIPHTNTPARLMDKLHNGVSGISRRIATAAGY